MNDDLDIESISLDEDSAPTSSSTRGRPATRTFAAAIDDTPAAVEPPATPPTPTHHDDDDDDAILSIPIAGPTRKVRFLDNDPEDAPLQPLPQRTAPPSKRSAPTTTTNTRLSQAERDTLAVVENLYRKHLTRDVALPSVFSATQRNIKNALLDQTGLSLDAAHTFTIYLLAAIAKPPFLSILNDDLQRLPMPALLNHVTDAELAKRIQTIAMDTRHTSEQRFR